MHRSDVIRGAEQAPFFYFYHVVPFRYSTQVLSSLFFVSFLSIFIKFPPKAAALLQVSRPSSLVSLIVIRDALSGCHTPACHGQNIS